MDAAVLKPCLSSLSFKPQVIFPLIGTLGDLLMCYCGLCLHLHETCLYCSRPGICASCTLSLCTSTMQYCAHPPDLFHHVNSKSFPESILLQLYSHGFFVFPDNCSAHAMLLFLLERFVW